MVRRVGGFGLGNGRRQSGHGGSITVPICLLLSGDVSLPSALDAQKALRFNHLFMTQFVILRIP